jgi:hypothetical protein
MNKSLIIVGVVFLVIGLAAGVFTVTQSHLFGLFSTSSIPYAPYMIPLLIVGIVLIIIGAGTRGEK